MTLSVCGVSVCVSQVVCSLCFVCIDCILLGMVIVFVAVVLVKKEKKPAFWVAGTPAFWAACATGVFLMALSRNPRLGQ